MPQAAADRHNAAGVSTGMAAILVCITRKAQSQCFVRKADTHPISKSGELALPFRVTMPFI